MLRLKYCIPVVFLVSATCLLFFIHSLVLIPKGDPTASNTPVISEWLGTDQTVFHEDDMVSHPLSQRPTHPKKEATNTEVRQRQYARRGHVQSVCVQNGLGDPVTKMEDIDPKDFSRIYVDDYYKLLYCEVPKVACTNWKRILLILTDKMNTTEPAKLNGTLVHSTYQKQYLRTLDSYKPKQILNKINNYYKFMFVREPLERIVSAFRSKLMSKYNVVYQQRFGRKIIQRYRKHASNSSLKYGNDVKFTEFVKYLLDSKTRQPFDPHWRPFYQLCHPCLVQYDFVGKYETLDDDVEFILRELGLEHLMDFPERPKMPASADILGSIFTNVSSEQIHNLWKLYSVDYAMFDYSYPNFVDDQ